jgi:hypothetical protein
MLAFVFLLLVAGTFAEGPIDRTCTLSGDPHFQTFKGTHFDLQTAGFFDFFISSTLKVMANFTWCNAAHTISCLSDVVIWTSLTNTGSGLTTRIDYLRSLSPAQYNYYTPAADLTPHSYAGASSTIQILGMDVYLTYSSGKLTVTGGALEGKAFTIVVYSSVLTITIGVPQGEGGWGSITGLCGSTGEQGSTSFVKRDGTTESTISESTSWYNQRTQINTWGLNYASASGTTHQAAPTTATIVNAAIGHPPATPPPPPSEATIAEIGDWHNWPSNRPPENNAQLLFDHAKANCLTEGAEGTDTYWICMYDFYLAPSAEFAADWAKDRKMAAAIWAGALTGAEASIIGIVVGCGLGFVVIVGVVAFFAKNPEKLPFTHKKAKVKAELAKTDVLPTA